MDQLRSISALLAAFRRTYNPWYLIRAALLIVRQRRLREVFHGLYCALMVRPARVSPDAAGEWVEVCRGLGLQLRGATASVSREQLIAEYSEYRLEALPDDFAGCRREGLAKLEPFLILGEYGVSSARIAVAKRHGGCSIADPYGRMRGVRHIHAVHPAAPLAGVYITTGDGAKVLDHWVIGADASLSLRGRIRPRLAGYTAMTTVGGKLYMGTDFSGRPNFLEASTGERFAFPEPAYRQYVVTLIPFCNRYIISLNKALNVMGGLRSVCVFDTVRQRFVFCARWGEIFGDEC